MVGGDEDGLLRLISNLLDNAIKYNRPAGAVRLRLRAESGYALARGRRHRHRHSGRRAAADLRALLPRRQGTFARGGRHRPRPRHRQARRPGPRRPGRGRERASAKARSSASCCRSSPSSRESPRILGAAGGKRGHRGRHRDEGPIPPQRLRFYCRTPEGGPGDDPPAPQWQPGRDSDQGSCVLENHSTGATAPRGAPA